MIFLSSLTIAKHSISIINNNNIEYVYDSSNFDTLFDVRSPYKFQPDGTIYGKSTSYVDLLSIKNFRVPAKIIGIISQPSGSGYYWSGLKVVSSRDDQYILLLIDPENPVYPHGIYYSYTLNGLHEHKYFSNSAQANTFYNFIIEISKNNVRLEIPELNFDYNITVSATMNLIKVGITTDDKIVLKELKVRYIPVQMCVL